MLSLVERRLGKPLVANRILAWYPKAFWGSGLMEGLVAHDEPEVPKRLLKLLRVYVPSSSRVPSALTSTPRKTKRAASPTRKSSP